MENSKEFKINPTITFDLTVDSDFINDVVTTALEGGINYWCGNAMPANSLTEQLLLDNDIAFLSDVLPRGGSIRLFVDEDDEPEQLKILTLDNFLSGLKTALEKKSIELDIFDDFDAADADCIVQYAIFGEIVYA